jgi:hypothetical protein
MKKLLPVLFFAAGLFSCKKIIQQTEENEIVHIMTSGVWFVQTYNQNDTSITGIFTGYTFQFYANGTVSAIKGGQTQATGTWVGNISNPSINSNFPGAGDPLDKLNSLWSITNTTDTSVYANTTIGSNAEVLTLYKQ